MKNKLIYILSVIAICLLPITSYSQQRSQKRHYTFEKIEMKSPWLLSGNAAGLVFNKADNFANVGGFYTNESGDYKNFNDPKTYSTYGVETKSYTKIKDVYFYGSFKYDYGVNEDLAWRGTIYPGSNLNPIVDSIPGKVLRESYILSGKVGYNLTDRISIGAAFDYSTNTAAKRIDGRNKNTLSKMNVSPGITFTTGGVKLGLNLNYKRDVEQVEYKYIGEATGKEIYYMEGLWFYVSSGITSTAMLDRKYLKDVFGGSFQFLAKVGNLRLFNQFSVNYGQEDNAELNNFDKRYASVESLNYNYDGKFRLIGNDIDHFLTLSFMSEENLSSNIVTNYERVPGEGNSWAYYEYGKTLRYVTSYQKYGAEYKTYIRDGEWRCSWILAAGINHHVMEKDYKVFPASYHQDYNISEIYLRAAKEFILNEKSSLNLEATGSSISASGTKLDAVNPLTMGALKLNRNILDTDYAYNLASRYNVGFNMKYMRSLNAQKGSIIYLGAGYRHTDAGDLGTRGFFSLSLGVNF